MLEELSARIKAAYVQPFRVQSGAPVGQNPFVDATPAQVPFYYRAYVVSNVDQPAVKLVLDLAPAPLWDASFEAGIRQTNYKDRSYGRSHDDRREYNLTVSYGDPRDFRITALANYEIVEFEQVYRNGAPASGLSPNDAGNFDWNTKNTQTNRLAGLIADWVPTERLALKASYFGLRLAAACISTRATLRVRVVSTAALVDYVTDNTQKKVVNPKGDYKIDKQWGPRLRAGKVRLQRRPDEKLPGLLPVLPVPGREQFLSSRGLRQSQLQAAGGLPDGELQVLGLAVPNGADSSAPFSFLPSLAARRGLAKLGIDRHGDRLGADLHGGAQPLQVAGTRGGIGGFRDARR
jgi:hypothetical protein